MSRKLVFIIIISLLFLLSTTFVSAEMIEKNDVKIDPEDYEDELMGYASKDEKIDVSVTSDIPVNVYIMASEDVNYFKPDFNKEKKKKEGVTSTSFTYTAPEGQSYYLYIYNPSNVTIAHVNYEYTDLLEGSVEEAMAFLGMATLICVAIIIIIVVVIALIIYFITRRRKSAPPPPPPPPMQQPGYPPQQPGYQQQPQQGYQGYPPPPPPPPPRY
jgi:disulfide bond formation protein DsbB